MKKVTFLTITAIVSVITLIAIININRDTETIVGSGSEAPAFTKEKQKWFMERYADPVTGELPPQIMSRQLRYITETFIPKDYKQLYARLLSDEMWNIRGPYEIGGRTRSLGLDIRNENIIVAGSVSGGMWRSVDGGGTWTKTTRYDQLHSSTCLVQDIRPGKEDNWYYGTGEYWGNSAAISGDGIYKSTDNGVSWEVIPSTSTSRPNIWDNPFDYCWNIVIDPTAPLERDDIYVATSNFGIMRSTDAGNTWRTVLGAASGAAFTDIAVTSEGVFYATLSSTNSVNQGIFRSTNGTDWTNITPPGFPRTYQRVVIGIAPSDENQVYFVGHTPGHGKTTFNSRGDTLRHSLWYYKYLGGDGTGENAVWEDRSMNLPKPDRTEGQMNSQQGYNLVIKVKPDNPDIVYLGAVALYRSDDGFRTPNFAWIGGTCPFDDCDYHYRYPNHHADLHAILFSQHDFNRVYTGSDGGIHLTLDGEADVVEWISFNNGYYTTQFYTVAIEHSARNSKEVIGGMQDNGTMLARTENIMDRWKEPLRADGFYCQIPAGAEYYYASQNSSYQPKIRIFRVKMDEDGKVLMQTRIDPIGGLDFIWNTPFMLDPNDNNKMYLAGGKMLWRNNDLSSIPMVASRDSTSIGWDSLSKTRIDFLAAGERITAVHVSQKPANIVYYGTSRGKVFRINDAHIGDPDIIDVTPRNISLGYVSSIATDPEDADDVIFSFSNYGILSVFRSTDGGNSWVSISGNLEENPNGSGAGPAVNWIEILKQGDKRIYFAGTSIGLFSTAFLNDNSTVWKKEGLNKIGNVTVHMVDARHSDSYVAVGTHAVGVFTGYYIHEPVMPGAIQLLAPINNVRHVRDTVTLFWTEAPNSGMYELQLSETGDFSSDIMTIHGIRETKVLVHNLEPGRKKYYWRVRSVNSDGVGTWSNVWSFNTIVEPPELLFPENGNLYVPINPTLEWIKVAGISTYRVQINSGFSINNPFLDTVVTGNTLELNDLTLNTRFVWRVSSIDEDNEGPFAMISYFMTREPTSVANILTNNRVTISPNPLRDMGNLRFELNNSSHIRAVVYDYYGRMVAVISDEHFGAGTYNIAFDFSGLSQGNYFLRFTAGGSSSGNLASALILHTIPFNIVR